MREIKFSGDEKAIIVKKVQLYFQRELDQDIGQFDAEFLLDFFAEEVGGFFYNRALEDSRTILSERLDSITDALYELEKPVNLR